MSDALVSDRELRAALALALRDGFTAEIVPCPWQPGQGAVRVAIPDSEGNVWTAHVYTVQGMRNELGY